MWPYCHPGLAELYDTCDERTKRASSCPVPASMRNYTGADKCVFHAVCGDGYCHDKLADTPPPPLGE